MTIAELFHKPGAREAAMFRYAAAHDHFSEEEQLALLAGRSGEAAELRQYAQWAVRAWDAEGRDPKPEGLS